MCGYRFYTGVFKDSSVDDILRFTDAGPGPAGAVMLVEFTLNGQKFTALNGAPEQPASEAMSLVIPCAGQAEVDYYWDALLAGGGQALGPGWVRDQYGICWQVVPVSFFDMIKDPARGPAVAGTMLSMTKFDVAALERAYTGG